MDAHKQFKTNVLNLEAVCHYFSVPIVSCLTTLSQLTTALRPHPKTPSRTLEGQLPARRERMALASASAGCYILTGKTTRKEAIAMNTVATTRMSSKGQVVIPEEVRNSLGLETGAQFIVMGENDVVILKTISPPSMSEFDSIVTRARRQAKAAGMKPSDIARAVAKVRGRARRDEASGRSRA